MQSFPDRKKYNVVSPTALNVSLSLNQFLSVTGVSNGDLSVYMGTGNYIDAIIVNNDVLLTYSVGCGDCPSGCTYGRRWQFRVNSSSDCSVTYLSSETRGLAVLMPELIIECFSIVVPVIFTSIKAFQKENYQVVQWEMQREDEVIQYKIECSADGINFRKIGQINIINPSSVPKTYSWIHWENVTGNNFYKIKMIDRSGYIKYSPIASLTIKQKASLNINPSFIQNGILNIQLQELQRGTYKVEFLNTTGSKVFTRNIQVKGSTVAEIFNIPVNVPAGIYILSVKGNTTLPVSRVFISR